MMRMPIPDLRRIAIDPARAERASVRRIEPVAEARRCAAPVPAGGELAVAIGLVVRLRGIRRIARGEAAGERADQESRMTAAGIRCSEEARPGRAAFGGALRVRAGFPMRVGARTAGADAVVRRAGCGSRGDFFDVAGRMMDADRTGRL